MTSTATDHETATASNALFRRCFEQGAARQVLLRAKDLKILAISDAYLEAMMETRDHLMGGHFS